jgi:hypothetical protein
MQQLIFYKVYLDVSKNQVKTTDRSGDSFTNAGIWEMTMSRFDENASRSALYAQVKELPVNAVQRELAVDTLLSAERIARRIVWVVNGIRHLVDRASAGAGAGAGHLTHEH